MRDLFCTAKNIKTILKRLVVAVAILHSSLFVLNSQAATLEGKVSKVSDGDTLWVNVQLENGVRVGERREKIRLDRIDAPESDQEYGKESAAYLRELILGRDVKVEYEKRDRYGRVVGLVYLGGKDVNLEMVATGNAWHYAYFDKTLAYAEAQKSAREGRLGLWKYPNPVNPREWRKRKK